MQSLSEIPCTQFMSYRDDDDMVYGFDMLSIYNLLKKVEEQQPIRTIETLYLRV